MLDYVKATVTHVVLCALLVSSLLNLTAREAGSSDARPSPQPRPSQPPALPGGLADGRFERKPPAPKGLLVLEPFDYKGVTLNNSRLKTQLDLVKREYLSIPNDDLLKGFRQRAGFPAPGNDLGGWYQQRLLPYLRPNRRRVKSPLRGDGRSSMPGQSRLPGLRMGKVHRT